MEEIIEEEKWEEHMKKQRVIDKKRSNRNWETHVIKQRNRPFPEAILEAQKNAHTRRLASRGRRRESQEEKLIDRRKQQLIDKYGTQPTICYFYYVSNPIAYVGLKTVRESFTSIKGRGNEVIVGDYGSTDGTIELAKKFGFKVVSVEKTEGIPFHMSKVINKVIHESKCNFMVDLNVHVTYPPNIDNFFRKWIKENDIKENILNARGYMIKKDGVKRLDYTASLLFYRPYFLEARGYDERTYYGNGTTHYGLALMREVYKLKWINKKLSMTHRYHNPEKYKKLKEELNQTGEDHIKVLDFGEAFLDEFFENFDEGVKKVHNSYW